LVQEYFWQVELPKKETVFWYATLFGKVLATPVQMHPKKNNNHHKVHNNEFVSGLGRSSSLSLTSTSFLDVVATEGIGSAVGVLKVS
jgi:hypothetical protein